ncbi:MAG: hypothetical protein MK066_14280 [Crocinitomicaceae bacterium]|nr:hypothetical protein [Crocinitomicaceae bacterium]
MNATKTILQLTITFHCIFSFAQSDTLYTITSEFIVPIQSNENQPINELTVNRLREKVLENNFILVGETHGVQESTDFIKQIAHVKKIDHFITEIDSFSIDYITQHMNISDTLLHRMPGVYSMYSYKEEIGLLNLLKDAHTTFDGVDLVHPVAIRLILFELSNSGNLNTRTINTLRKLIESHSRDLSKGFLSSKINKRTIQFLSKLINDCPEYEQSLIKYALNHKYPPNFMEARAKYTVNRMSYLINNSDLTSQNVLFKFGASHTMKTKNTAGFHDIGWFVDSLAKQKLVDAYFLTIVPISGKVGLPFEIDGLTSKSFDFNSRYYESLRNLYDSVNQGERSIFVDVESFRQSLNDSSIISSELKYILDNYDGILFIDQVTPSTTFKTIVNKT